MKISYDGKVYDFAFTDLDVGECEAIEKFTGARGLGDWSNMVTTANTKALQALWWAVRRHDGQDPGPISRADPAMKPVAFNNAFVEAQAAEEAEAAAAAAEEEAGPDPTSPAGSSPEPAATTTTPGAAPATSLLTG